jgi:hypothetical protein
MEEITTLVQKNMISNERTQIVGTSVDHDPNSNLIAIVGDYHGRYEDDDCVIFCYDTNEKDFVTKMWTTRGAMIKGMGAFDFKYKFLQDCDETILEEIRVAARKREPKNAIWYVDANYTDKKYKYSYQQESLKKKREELLSLINKVRMENKSVLELISLFYNESLDGYDTTEYLCAFLHKVHALSQVQIEVRARKPRKIHVSGDKFEGNVFYIQKYMGMFGAYYKVGMSNESGNGKSVWMILNKEPKKHDKISVAGIIRSETEKSISLEKAKRIDNIEPSLLIWD